MSVLLIVLIALVALIILVVGIGFALPRTHRASSRITLPHAPADVWAIVRDPTALLGTWKELKSSRVVPPPDQGGKEVWEQNAGGFPIRLVVEESDPPRRLLTRIDAAPDAAFGGTWTYQLDAIPGGTRVTLTEDGYVRNPVFRVMMVASGVHRTTDGYLNALGRKLGATVTPEHLK